MQRVLDSMRDVPAFVRNGRLDVLASNALGEALYSLEAPYVTREPAGF